MNLIKNWPTNLSWFIKFDVVKAFDTVNRNRLKNIFLKYCPEHRIWSELNKLMKAGITDLGTTSVDDLGVSQGSMLSPFLFNGKINVLTSNNKRLSEIGAILSAVNRKQIRLCFFHHLEFEIGNYSPLNTDFTSKVYKIDCSNLNFEEIFLGRQSN